MLYDDCDLLDLAASRAKEDQAREGGARRRHRGPQETARTGKVSGVIVLLFNICVQYSINVLLFIALM